MHDVKTGPSVCFLFHTSAQLVQISTHTAEEAKTYHKKLVFLLHEEVRTIQHLHFMPVAGNMIKENLFGSLSSVHVLLGTIGCSVFQSVHDQ